MIHAMEKNIKIAVITTDSDKLAVATGFGSWEKTEAVASKLGEHYKNVQLHKANSQRDLENIATTKPDLVVVGAKFINDNGNIIWLPEFLEQNGINYTGSSKQVMEADLDKVKAKKIAASSAIKTAEHFTAMPGEFTNFDKLPLKFPLFIKPVGLLDSMGVNENSLVHNFEQFEKQVNYINDVFNQKAIAEPYLNGREFTVAVLENKERIETFPVELIPENGKFITFDAKEKNTETLLKITDAKTYALVSGVAKKAFKTLGARDWARIDIKMDEAGSPHFTEFTTTPGLSPVDDRSYFKHAVAIASGMGQSLAYEYSVLSIVQAALARTQHHGVEASSSLELTISN